MDARVEAYVGYWEADRRTGEVHFTYDSTWSVIKEVLEFHVRHGRGGEERKRLFGQLSKLWDDAVRGVPRDPECGQPGFFRVERLAPERPAELFAVVTRPGTPFRVELLGPADVVEAELAEARRRFSDLTVDRAVLSPNPLRPATGVPSEARCSDRAQRALDRIREGVPTVAAIAKLDVQELTWLGHELGRERLRSAFIQVAQEALQRRRTTSTLNLCGSAFRLDWPSESAKLFRESIVLEESARDNPYAWIGLAASLGRLHEPDEAEDCLKKVLRWHPDNKYALNVQRRIRKQAFGIRAFRVVREEDEAPSLIEPLPIPDDDPWSPTEWV